MQLRHLIILALVGIVVLLGFNIINAKRHEQSRAVVSSSAIPTSTISTQDSNPAIDIASQPLENQPKAIIDKATTQINQAEQADQDRLEQMNDAQ